MRLLVLGAVLAALGLALLWLCPPARSVDAAPAHVAVADAMAGGIRAGAVPAERAPARTLPPPSASSSVPREEPELVAREILVLDADSVPLAGARVYRDASLDANGEAPVDEPDATTGFDGRARLDVSTSRGAMVQVCADGFQLVSVCVPPASTQWIVRVPRASRIEITLLGHAPLDGVHAELRLPREFAQRTFYQRVRTRTAGRVVDGAHGWWSEHHQGSTWTLVFSARRRAVVDQIHDAGTVVVSLQRFGVELAQREVVLPRGGVIARVELDLPAPPPEIEGLVLDEQGRPLAGVSVRVAPFGGHEILDDDEGFPIWAPSTLSAADGSFRVPRPERRSERVVVMKCGYGDRVLTVDELDTLRGRVRLASGRAFVLEAVDRDGKPMDGGTPIGTAHNYARPSVHLGHDVWRGASSREHPAAAGRDFNLPFFLFADLPAGDVTIRFTHLLDTEVLVHDTRVASARFVARDPVDEMCIGK